MKATEIMRLKVGDNVQDLRGKPRTIIEILRNGDHEIVALIVEGKGANGVMKRTHIQARSLGKYHLVNIPVVVSLAHRFACPTCGKILMVQSAPENMTG
jgi:hypothetical protein